MTTAQVACAWGDYLRSFHWQLLAHMTFVRAVSEHTARNASERWVNRLCPRAYAFIALEAGPYGGLIHAHALVGGVLTSTKGKTGPNPWEGAVEWASALWNQGDIQIAKFDPTLGGTWYVAKDADRAHIVGSMRAHRPRRRRRRSHAKRSPWDVDRAGGK